jgi:hypothetical protein
MRAWKKVGLGALAATVIGGGAQVGAMAASRSDDAASVRPRSAAVEIRREDRRDDRREDRRQREAGDVRREDRRENRREDRREAEPGDDHGREIEPGDGHGREIEPGDDHGRDEGMEQGEDRSGPSDNSGPG